jgi:hypothetical protein
MKSSTITRICSFFVYIQVVPLCLTQGYMFIKMDINNYEKGIKTRSTRLKKNEGNVMMNNCLRCSNI